MSTIKIGLTPTTDSTRWRPLGEENRVVGGKGLENVTVEEVLKTIQNKK